MRTTAGRKWTRMALQAVAVLSIVVVISSCARDEPYHDTHLSPSPGIGRDWPTCAGDDRTKPNACDAKAVLQHRANPQLKAEDDQGYLLGFVELDDQGWQQDRNQLKTVGDRLLDYGRATDTQYVMVFFAHGWHHNAKMDDRNVQEFRELLEKLDRDEMLRTRLKPQVLGKDGKLEPARRRKVVGVYLGWRGQSIDVPLLDTVTFWTRKNAAGRVGDGATEALFRLNQVRAQLNRADDDHLATPNESQLLIIGHSFGGLLVHRAVHTPITERAFRTFRGEKNDIAKSFGDLVLLVNPAFEGSAYETLHRAGHERTYSAKQRPAMMIVTSESDWATGWAFPLGRLYTVLQSAPQQGEWEAVRNTVGHLDRYRTHHLSWDKAPGCDKPADPAVTEATARAQLMQVAAEPGVMAVPNNKYGCAILTAVNQDPTAKHVPYLVVTASKEVIDGHNDIFNPHFVEFVRTFMWREVTSPNGVSDKRS